MGSAGGDPEDSFAILLALHSPELVVEGLTVVQGNVPVDHGYANAVHLLELLGRRDVPVCSGVDRPLDPGRGAQLAWLAQRGNLERLVPACKPPAGDPHAVDFLIQTVRENPDEITLVTIGPLSNVAAALEREAGLARNIPRLVMMAGAANVPGNITPAAEFNVWADPEAASRVFESGVPITMVGLDVCEQTHLHQETVDRLASAPSEPRRCSRGSTSGGASSARATCTSTTPSRWPPRSSPSWCAASRPSWRSRPRAPTPQAPRSRT
jgi:purine nucleosidase